MNSLRDDIDALYLRRPLAYREPSHGAQAYKQAIDDVRDVLDARKFRLNVALRKAADDLKAVMKQAYEQ